MALRPLDLWRLITENFTFRVDADKTEHENTEEVTRAAATLVAAVTAEPIPWVDLALILPLQVKLVVHIGRIYGFDVSRARARRVILELLGAVAYGWAWRQALRELGKVLFPFVGGLLTAPLAYAGTFALGHLAERYFRAQRGDLPPLSDEERRALTGELLEQGRGLGERLSASDLRRAALEARRRVANRGLPRPRD